MFRWASRLVGQQATRAPRRKRCSTRGAQVVRARYDAAQHTDNSRKHWAGADALSARAANSPSVRRTLRIRSRYEVANNSYARGIVSTLANDAIGTGPRLQMLAGGDADRRLLEAEFTAWAAAIDLPAKLRTLRMARCQDGEAFALFIDNPMLSTPVRLDLRLLEADQVCTPDPRIVPDGQAVDGIVFDGAGNPVEYHILREHPGDLRLAAGLAFDRVPAAAVIHDFRCERPGQARGIPELTAALPLFALLRDYTLATLDAAKAVAYFAGVLFTDAPPNGEADPVEPMDLIEMERNLLLTLPGGWKLGQIKAEQPASTYAEFKREVLGEIARCLSMPFNVAAGNSSGYNYASGRLDHQTYFKAIRVDQEQIGRRVLDRIFLAWFREAVLIEGYLPQRLRVVGVDLSHQWFFDGAEHVDPQKEAAAQQTRLAAHTTTLADEYARRGLDWETQLRQRAREIALMQELGLAAAPPAAPADDDDPEEEPVEEPEDEEASTDA